MDDKNSFANSGKHGGVTLPSHCRNLFPSKFAAFTLAEVLITLGIIGVVAAMTIPTLINNYQKKVTLTRLKQSYAIVQNAFLASQVENGDPQTWGLKNYKLDYDDETAAPLFENITVQICEKYLLPYLKTAAKSEYIQLKNAGWDEIYLLSGMVSERPGKGQMFYVITLANGTTLMAGINGTGTTIASIIIYIDINGTQKPNIVGKDIFTTELNFSNGRFGFYGADYSDNSVKTYCTDQSTHRLSSMCCGELILRNSWEFPEDYAWK